MPVWAEVLLLIVVALAVAAVGADLARDWLRGPRDLLHAERSGRQRPQPEPEGAPALGAVERRLRAAGLPVSPLTFFSASALLAILAAFALFDLLPAVPLAAAAGGALVAYAPWVAARSFGRWRARRFEAQLADSLGFMVGSLEAGENALQAIATAAEASEGAARRALGAVARRLRMGMTIRRALRPMMEEYDSEGVQLFAQTLIAKWQAGGDLVPILESVSRVVRERMRVRLRLQSQLAGARVAGAMIALLPYAVIPVYIARAPDLLNTLLGHPLGPTLLVVAVLLQVVGFLWLFKILRIEL